MPKKLLLERKIFEKNTRKESEKSRTQDLLFVLTHTTPGKGRIERRFVLRQLPLLTCLTDRAVHLSSGLNRAANTDAHTDSMIQNAKIKRERKNK